jgi:hypothetical protein
LRGVLHIRWANKKFIRIRIRSAKSLRMRMRIANVRNEYEGRNFSWVLTESLVPNITLQDSAFFLSSCLRVLERGLALAYTYENYEELNFEVIASK